MIEVWNLFLLLILMLFFYFPPEPRSGAAKRGRPVDCEENWEIIHTKINSHNKMVVFSELELELEIVRPVFPAPARKGGFWSDIAGYLVRYPICVSWR